MNYLILIMAGVITGIFSGFFGIGGGIILIPFLVLLLHFSQQTANGITLMTLLIPAGILGVLEYFKAGIIGTQHIKYSLLIALGILLGAYLGSKFAVHTPEHILKKSFSILLVVVAIRLWFAK